MTVRSDSETIPEPTLFLRNDFVHNELIPGFHEDRFDGLIRKSPRRPENILGHAERLGSYIVSGERLADLPDGHILAPNDNKDWYVEHGTLLVVDSQQLLIGKFMGRHQLAGYPFQNELFQEPAHTLLARKFNADSIPGRVNEMRIDIPIFAGLNQAGQQMVIIRCVRAAILQENNKKFFASTYCTKLINEKQVAGTSSNTPVFKDLYLPATINEPTEVMQVKPGYTIVTQKVRGVSVLDVPDQRPQHRRGKGRRILGRLALTPNLGNI